jgi:hypothetical protein
MTMMVLCCKAQDDQYLAVCLLVYEEEDYIIEWLEYHYRKGVSKVYLFDHGSTVNLTHIIGPYIRTGLVHYIYYPREPATIKTSQLDVFKQCVHEFLPNHQFMAFLDCDEFVVTTDPTKSIPSILRNYEDFPGLALNWMMMGNYTLEHRPRGGVLPNYAHCRPHPWLKSFVRGNSDVTHYAVHNMGYSNGKRSAVDTSKNEVKGQCNPQTCDSSFVPSYVYDIMYINHYITKSYEDFLIKKSRGHPSHPQGRREDFFYHGVQNELRASNWTCTPLQMPEDLHYVV